ncbi:BadF/BadG/BcrA/BcrD ATPase family protein [Kitasatospora sp. NPDC094015]|uniref:N-acetylglucosamine kinase n=1 Tax=Kitasatospora sp. NPDC094015 TaxID=3155205 RepID=UPI00331E9B27
MTGDALFLAVDGGNSKTDAYLGTADGQLLGGVRGGPFRPQVTGLGPALDALGELLDTLLHRHRPAGRPVERLSAFLAGADLPEEERQLTAALAERGWARHSHAGNDTFALLHAGAAEGWGVAVVCGTGINCVGVAPDGAVARFPALGAISGDWGGGADLGREVLRQAVRAEDGRGPATTLAAAVAAHFGRDTVAEVTVALHTGTLAPDATNGLTHLLFHAATRGDRVARGILDRQADEIAAMGLTALRRLDLLGRPVDVVLGGGILAARHPYLAGRVAERFAAAPHAVLRTVTLPPVAGAALHALGELHAADRTGEDHRHARDLVVKQFATAPGGPGEPADAAGPVPQEGR